MLQRTLAITIVLVSIAACGTASDKTDSAHLRGTVSGLSTQNGRAVAVTSQGKAYWTNLDAKGAFDLTVPSGVTLRLFVASAPAVGGHPIAGHLVGAGGGAWITSTAGTTQLGVIRPATAVAPGGIATKTEAAEASGENEDKGDDAAGSENESHDDSGEKDELCGGAGANDVELHADSAPTSSKDTDDKAEKEQEDKASEKTCSN
jgi:hypothetical protein